MTTQLPLSGPMSVGDLLDRAFRLYRARFGTFLLTSAIFFAPVGIFSVFLRGEAYAFFFADLLDLPARAFVTLALTAQGVEALHGRTATTRDGIRRGLRRSWPYAGMMIVKWAAILGTTTAALFIYVIGLLLLEGLIGSPLPSADDWIAGGGETIFRLALEAIDLSILGVLPLIIWLIASGVYLYARWFAAPSALLAEGTGAIDSLRRSWHLSAANVWRIAGYVLLLGLLVIVLPSMFQSALKWIFDLILPAVVSEAWSQFDRVFTYLLVMISTPFGVSAAVLLYYDLRIRKESYDLELRVAELEVQTARDAGQDAP